MNRVYEQDQLIGDVCGNPIHGRNGNMRGKQTMLYFKHVAILEVNFETPSKTVMDFKYFQAL